jgi:predicted DNA-binding antitoxin AbrB/MazE fold protein
MSSQVVDGIYTGGILKPLTEVTLQESERVRLFSQTYAMVYCYGKLPWTS